ncbi:hypothetical protein PGB90_001270 [Kerria lacca]
MTNYSSATPHLLREIDDEIREINKTNVRTGTATPRAREVQLELQSMKDRLEDIKRSISRRSIREQTRNTSTPDGRRTISIGSRSTSSSYDTVSEQSVDSESDDNERYTPRTTSNLRHGRWDVSLSIRADSFSKYQRAFLREFFSADIQFEVYSQFIVSKPSLRRNELLIYYDEWHERLSVLSKPKKSEEEIVLELSRKAPKSIEQGVRCRRYKAYSEFRRVISDRHNADNTGSALRAPDMLIVITRDVRVYPTSWP